MKHSCIPTSGRSRNKQYLFTLLILWLLATASAIAQSIAPDLGEAREYGLLSGNTITSSKNLYINGRLGAVNSVSSQIKSTEGNFTAEPASVGMEYLNIASNYCLEMSQGNHIDGEDLMDNYSPAVYDMHGNAFIRNGAALELSGSDTDVFIFNIQGDLTVESDVQLILNGIKPENIYWNIQGNVIIDGASSFSGVVISAYDISLKGQQTGRMSLLAHGNIDIIDHEDSFMSNTFSALQVYREYNDLINNGTSYDLTTWMDHGPSTKNVCQGNIAVTDFIKLPNEITVSSGNGGNGVLILQVQLPNDSIATLFYHAKASQANPNPANPADVALGETYVYTLADKLVPTGVYLQAKALKMVIASSASNFGTTQIGTGISITTPSPLRFQTGCNTTTGTCSIGPEIVQNGSFEDLLTTPPSVFYETNIPEARHWQGTGSLMANGDGKYPHYYSGNMSYNIGAEMARTGNNYAAIKLYDHYLQPPPNPLNPPNPPVWPNHPIPLGTGTPITIADFRDYLVGELTTPLIQGSKYKVEFWVSYGEASGMVSSNLGIYFSNNQTHKNALISNGRRLPGLSYNHNQLLMCMEPVTIRDGWAKLSFTYTAQGNETFFAIGNFYSPTLTSYHFQGWTSPDKVESWYLIDDVSVREFTPSSLNVDIASNHPDAVCNNSQVTLTATASGGTGPYTFNWTNPTFGNAPSVTTNGNTSTAVYQLSNPVTGMNPPILDEILTVSINDANNCTSENSVIIGIVPQLNDINEYTCPTTNLPVDLGIGLASSPPGAQISVINQNTGLPLPLTLGFYYRDNISVTTSYLVTYTWGAPYNVSCSFNYNFNMVAPKPSLFTADMQTNICQGATQKYISVDFPSRYVQPAGLVYSWEVSTSLNGTYTPLGVTSSSYLIPTTTLGTLYYRVRVHCGNPAVFELSDPIAITIQPTSNCCTRQLQNGWTAIQSYYEKVIGNANTMTVIDASQYPYNTGNYQGTVVFDGKYNIKGTVILKNGTFKVPSGGILYFDGPSNITTPICSSLKQAGAPERISLLLDNATLELEGGTLTAYCNDTWGGVYAYNNSIVRTNSSNGTSTGTWSEISKAYFGLAMFQGANCDQTNNNQYYIHYTNFLNNGTGFADLEKGVAVYGETITNSLFENNTYGIRFNGIGTSMGYFSNYSWGPWIEGNTLRSNSWGIKGYANNISISNNVLKNHSNAAISVGPSQIGYVTYIDFNNIEIPASSASSPSNGVVIGIDACDNGYLTRNTIYSAGNNAASLAGTQVGIFSSNFSDHIFYDNELIGLEQGITLGPNGYPSNALQLTSSNGSAIIDKNIFRNDILGVRIYNPGMSNPNISIRCNDFYNLYNGVSLPDITGIKLESNSVVNATNEIGSPTDPAGNRFINFFGVAGAKPVFTFNVQTTTGTVGNLKYYAYNSTQESPGIITFRYATTRAFVNSGANPTNACYGTPGGVNYRVAQSGSDQSEESLDVQPSLEEAYPNPTSFEATVTYFVPETAISAKLVFYDVITGKPVNETLKLEKGKHAAQLPVSKLKAGIYSYTLLVDEKPIATKKLVIVK